MSEFAVFSLSEWKGDDAYVARQIFVKSNLKSAE
jgi:hypothetical protein|tara:strand:- start:2831 stop:2932 length:102 start_codon:yes stop_codon:yes gene_type:complete